MINNKPIKIFIAEDHALFADGLEKLLSEEQQRYQIVGKAFNGKTLLHAVHDNVPDILLLDINMPKLNGIDAARTLKHSYPQLKIIFLSMDTNPMLPHKLQKENFDAFVPKDVSIDKLKFAINQVMSGNQVFITHQSAIKADMKSDHVKLSPRQKEIIVAVKAGVNTNKEIAELLNISVFTVETHLKNIFQVLRVKSKLEMIKQVDGIMNDDLID
jgi:DNA-binding NarL/FixJ family response regulator